MNEQNINICQNIRLSEWERDYTTYVTYAAQ